MTIRFLIGYKVIEKKKNLNIKVMPRRWLANIWVAIFLKFVHLSAATSIPQKASRRPRLNNILASSKDYNVFSAKALGFEIVKANHCLLFCC
jgi:hypothetical protein